MNKSDSTHLHNAFVWVGTDLLASKAKSALIIMFLSSEKLQFSLPPLSTCHLSMLVEELRNLNKYN